MSSVKIRTFPSPKNLPFTRREGWGYHACVIDTDRTLGQWLPKLELAEWVAVDTEADSLHAYPEKLCLIQLSIAGNDVLLDPLSSMDLGPVLEALRRHELILHGADYDLRLLYRTYGFVPERIFDTMLAARLLGLREFGLSILVENLLGVKLEKGPQKANWGRRPLTERMEAYARNDTRYLRALAVLLASRLRELGRLGWHAEACHQLVAECAQRRVFEPDTLWRVKGSHRLSPAALAVLRSLWQWREEEAVRANKPPFFVLPPELMVRLASAAGGAAAGGQDLVDDILPPHLTSRRRTGILDAVRLGLADTEPPRPVWHIPYRQSEAARNRYQKLEKRRDEQAVRLQIDPTLIASRATLLDLAHDWDGHAVELMRWQRELLEENG